MQARGPRSQPLFAVKFGEASVLRPADAARQMIPALRARLSTANLADKVEPVILPMRSRGPRGTKILATRIATTRRLRP